MKKYIIYFLNIFVIFSIYSQEKVTIENEKSSKNIYLDIVFDKDIKINDKVVLFDLTSDIQKYLKNKDKTDDLLKTNKFIYKIQDLNHYKEIENIFSNLIKEDLENTINDKNINIILNKKENEKKNGINININIFNYTEGEYNLISNRKSNIKLLVKINNKDSKNNFFLLQVYNYFCKSDLLNPTEYLRLKFISKKLVNDLYKKLKNYKIINSKVNNY